MTVQDHTHVIINGRLLLPGFTFKARNSVSGTIGLYRYRGITGTTKSGRTYVYATNSRGLARYIDVDTITLIPRKQRAA